MASVFLKKSWDYDCRAAGATGGGEGHGGLGRGLSGLGQMTPGLATTRPSADACILVLSDKARF